MLDEIKQTTTKTFENEAHVRSIWSGEKEIVSHLLDIYNKIRIRIPVDMHISHNFREKAQLILSSLHVGCCTFLDLQCI